MYFLIVGSKLSIHLECLKCSVCLQKLEMQSKCFVKNGRFFCQDHYPTSTDTEPNCANCKLRLMPSDYVIRSNTDRLYHLNCFKCTKCTRQIEPGTKYGLVNDLIYCSHHYFNQDDTWLINTDMNNNNNNNNSSDGFRYDQSFSSSSGDSSPLSFNPQLKSLENRSNLSTNTSVKINTTTSTNSSSRKKRLRTSFKHQQLRIMKAHFQINQNPDSKDLKELSERTGLQKRVLQVWFQNSRAKQRKSSNGSFVSLGGILSKQNESSIQMINKSSMNFLSNQNEDTNFSDENDDSNDDENLEYEIDDELNESTSKSMDENYATSEQAQYFQNNQPQQQMLDFYNCF
ncbi:unnamed protein product [Brachionus calyciflorus]|uniref:Uncharacterized protein n=1 Tax=Brachionus calyciflorus TaxID=104777 RepID=A0A813X3S8_9BILA|nr:unnamed protein product [Brachionus calyciflorus]